MRKHVDPLPNLSIKQKLMFMVMVSTVIALVLISIVFVVYYVIDSKNRMAQELTVLAKIIGNRSSAAIIYDDKKLAYENLSAFSEKNSINLSCIYLPDKTVFSSYSVTNIENLCPPAFEIGHYFSSDMLKLAQEITLEGEKIGYIYIESDLVEIKNNLIRYAFYVTLLIICAVFITYLISSKLQAIISEPIFHLVDTAKAISGSGNYSFRAIKTSYDELGILVDAFNRMVSQVQERDKALLGAKVDLEKRVAERTHDLEVAKEAAEQANAAKSLFLTNMSHELRTPMHAILSFANFGMEAINSKFDQEELLHYYKRIRDSGNRLLSLVNNLLDLSKLESGKMDFIMKKVDLEKTANSVIQELQPLISQKNLNLKINKEKPHYIAEFDSARIIQVIYNLLSNSIKFTPEGKSITISFKETSLNLDGKDETPAIEMSIEDEGIGIPEDELEKVFDKFYQSSKTKTGAGGTGLGLAICLEIVKGHHGKIWAENISEGGARFSFVLPIERQNNQQGSEV